jgi:cystathionine beta-lyase/cystathionine gamma-synthase
MTGLEIALLVIGIMIMIASFIFATDKQKTETEAVVTGELSVKQKEEIDRQIKEILDVRMDEVKEQTEINLDKLSNRKMLEMNEYSDTILAEINRNHNEVMFLYDMLNEKKKEINIAVRDINIAKKELEKNIAEWIGTKKCVCLNSQTACAEMALHVMGIGAGDEVITSAYTYTASASVIAHVGAKIVLIDT